jgi:signal transduction histidine kinase
VGIAVTLAMPVRVTTGPHVAVSAADEIVIGALAILAGGALVWRRQRPRLAIAIAVAASGVHALIAGPLVPVAGWVAIVVGARHLPTLQAAVRDAVGAACGVLVGSLAGALLHDRTSMLPVLTSLTVIVLLAAIVARLQTARAQSHLRQQEVERSRAVIGERLRIARDMHDLVGHGLSTIAVQSGAARLALDAGDQTAARRALGAVEEASRVAMAEMRQMLGVLRTAEIEPEAAPVAGVERLGALVEDARAGGHPVTVERSGPWVEVPEATGVTAYRVLQEALTNVARHAPGAPITISLRASQDILTIEVVDDGSVEVGEPENADGRPSYGLVGLRERVGAAGGTLEAGPRHDAPGWRVAVRLPMTVKT